MPSLHPKGAFDSTSCSHSMQYGENDQIQVQCSAHWFLNSCEYQVIETLVLIIESIFFFFF